MLLVFFFYGIFFLDTSVCNHIYIYILPYPRRVEFSGEEVIVLPLVSIASLLNLYIHLHGHPQPVGIMLAMFSLVLEIRLHTVYLTYSPRTHHHILQ